MIRVLKKTTHLLREHPFLRDLNPLYLDSISDCATPLTLSAGSFVFHKGEVVESCYLIRQGRINLQLRRDDGSAMVVETLGYGDVLGWSWLEPPYRATLDARVILNTTVIRLDGACLRRCIEADDRLGFILYKRFKPIMARHMAASRRQFYQNRRAISG